MDWIGRFWEMQENEPTRYKRHYCKTGGGRWSAVDWTYCSVGNPARVGAAQQADSLVLAKTCVSEPVWQLCAAMATRLSGADGGEEAERRRRGGGEEEDGRKRRRDSIR